MKHGKELGAVLADLGIKAGSEKRAAYTKTKRVRLGSKWALVGGAMFLTSVVWTVTYNHATKTIVEAHRVEKRQISERLIALTNILVVVTTGAGVFNVPHNWDNASNFVECYGQGGYSGIVGAGEGGAGSGGSYSRTNNIVAIQRGTLQYFIANGSTSLNSTWISTTLVAPTSTTEGCLAVSGRPGSGQSGGVGTTTGSIGDIKFAGGNGSPGTVTGTTFVFRSPGFGGGCAGPGGRGGHGAGGGGGGGAGPFSPGGDAGGGLSGKGVGGDGIGGNGCQANPALAPTTGTNYQSGPNIGTGGGNNVSQGQAGILYGGGASGSSSSFSTGGAGFIVFNWDNCTTAVDAMHWRPQPTHQKLHGHPARKRLYINRLRFNPYYKFDPFYPVPITYWEPEPGPGTTWIRNIEPALRDDDTHERYILED